MTPHLPRWSRCGRHSLGRRWVWPDPPTHSIHLGCGLSVPKNKPEGPSMTPKSFPKINRWPPKDRWPPHGHLPAPSKITTMIPLRVGSTLFMGSDHPLKKLFMDITHFLRIVMKSYWLGQDKFWDMERKLANVWNWENFCGGVCLQQSSKMFESNERNDFLVPWIKHHGFGRYKAKFETKSYFFLSVAELFREDASLLEKSDFWKLSEKIQNLGKTERGSRGVCPVELSRSKISWDAI